MHKEPEESELAAGEIIACRYRVEAHYRRHPLGELYRCRDQDKLESSVLLQRLRREFARPGVQDRLFETRGSASLESPVIADILDYGEDIDGRPFLVTPWSDDASLDAVERPLGFAEAVTIVVRVAEALAPLHARGLLHGGIEPASILVDDQRELTNMLGFGLAPALAAGADRTRALPLLVSPGYAAPELITGAPLGPAADVYALGVLLWELIFGQVPFRGPILRVLDAHLNRAPPDLELPFDAPASFAATLQRMLAKQPADRFPDAGAVAARLREHLLEPAAFVPVPLASATLDPSTFVDYLDRVHREDEEDETVLFKTLPNLGRIASPPKPPPKSVPAAHSRSRVLPKLALALAMCTGLLLLSMWAIDRAQFEIAAKQSNAVEPEHALASARAPEPIPIEAVTRVPPRPTAPVRVERPLLPEQLDASQFRAQKPQLHAGIARACNRGSGVKRTVKLTVQVDGRGRVETANVLGPLSKSRLGRCVEREASAFEFPASRDGGAYTYRLRLRS
jgi:serine/threonine protein kinase